MNYKLICVHPFKGYTKGQEITDQDEVAKLSTDRGHHFVKVAQADPPKPAPKSSEPAEAQAVPVQSQK